MAGARLGYRYITGNSKPASIRGSSTNPMAQSIASPKAQPFSESGGRVPKIAEKMEVPMKGGVKSTEVPAANEADRATAELKPGSESNPLGPPATKQEKTSNAKDDTLSASKDSAKKDGNKQALPLDQVNTILTPQEEMAMRSLPGNKDVWLDIVSRPLDNVIQDFKEDKIESPRPPSRNFGTKAKVRLKRVPKIVWPSRMARRRASRSFTLLRLHPSFNQLTFSRGK